MAGIVFAGGVWGGIRAWCFVCVKVSLPACRRVCVCVWPWVFAAFDVVLLFRCVCANAGHMVLQPLVSPLAGPPRRSCPPPPPPFRPPLFGTDHPDILS